MKILIAIVLSISSLSWATEQTPHLSVSKVKPAAMRIGKVGDAVVTAVVVPGIHVQANPASQPNLVATQLKFDASPDFEVETILYPEGKPYRLENSDRDIGTYDGTFEIKVPIRAKTSKSGSHVLKGKIRFQACNDKTCFFPSSIPFSIPITVYK